MIAVNLCDWTARHKDQGLAILLVPVTGFHAQRVECEKGRVDSVSLVLECDEERARAIVAVARLHYKKHELRFYVSSKTGKSWKRI